MIIIGYQGIGKSTLTKNSNGYIDLMEYKQEELHVGQSFDFWSRF